MSTVLFILVNLTAFQVEVFYQGRSVYQSRALVGQSDTPTPEFDAEILSIVLNPSWQIPESIVAREILPLIRKHPDEMEKKGFSAFEKMDGRQVSLREVRSSSRYIFKQSPGPSNPLGDIKFSSENRYSIIIHGTYEKELFHATNREVSHGCVRVEKSRELAIVLLRAMGFAVDGHWVSKALETNQEREVRLPRKIPVYFRKDSHIMSKRFDDIQFAGARGR